MRLVASCGISRKTVWFLAVSVSLAESVWNWHQFLCIVGVVDSVFGLVMVQSSLFGDVIPKVLPTSWLSKCAIHHSMVAWLATALGSPLKFASASCVRMTVGSWCRRICLHKKQNGFVRAAEVFLPLTVMVCGRPDQRTLGSKAARDLSPEAQKSVTATFLMNQICCFLEHSRKRQKF